MNIPGYRIIGPLAYIGKEGCRNVTCTRIRGEDRCRGYHCSYCDEPCSMMGHGCQPAAILLDEAEQIMSESTREMPAR